MTMQEYKRVQCPAILEPFWIGQGYGYKNMSLCPSRFRGQ